MSLVDAVDVAVGGCRRRRGVVSGTHRKRNDPLGLGLLLIFPEGWNDDVSVAGIGTMDRLAVVAESLLGEALRIAGRLGTLRPGVAVGVQRHPGDFQPPATLLELGRAVGGAHPAQIGEERSTIRKGTEQGGDGFVEADGRVLARFLAGVADDAVGPVDVVRVQERDVGLGGPEVPRHFIERPALVIAFAGDDGPVFIMGGGALGLVADGGPLLLGDDRPGEPAHVQGEVVESAEVNVGRDRADVEDAQEVLGLGFDNRQLTQRRKGSVLDGRVPAAAGLTLFGPHQFRHHVFPIAGGGGGIPGLPVDAGQLEAEGGGGVRFVARGDEPVGLGLVAGVQGLLLLGL